MKQKQYKPCIKCRKKYGFCSHTIKEELKESMIYAENFISSPEYLARFLSLEYKKTKNLHYYLNEKDNEIKTLNNQINNLKIELKHYSWLDIKLRLITGVGKK